MSRQDPQLLERFHVARHRVATYMHRLVQFGPPGDDAARALSDVFLPAVRALFAEDAAAMTKALDELETELDFVGSILDAMTPGTAEASAIDAANAIVADAAKASP